MTVCSLSLPFLIRLNKYTALWITEGCFTYPLFFLFSVSVSTQCGFNFLKHSEFKLRDFKACQIKKEIEISNMSESQSQNLTFVSNSCSLSIKPVRLPYETGRSANCLSACLSRGASAQTAQDEHTERNFKKVLGGERESQAGQHKGKTQRTYGHTNNELSYTVWLKPLCCVAEKQQKRRQHLHSASPWHRICERLRGLIHRIYHAMPPVITTVLVHSTILCTW